MISEFSTSPKPQNKSAHTVCAVAMAVFAALAIAYAAADKYKGVIGLAALAFLTAGIYIYTKYVAVKYYYDVTFDADASPIFVVRQLTGKRCTTNLRISLCDIREIVKENKEERRKSRAPEGVARYYYTPTLFPDITYRIIVKSRYESCEVLIEGSDGFAEMLLAYANEARMLSQDEEDDY